MPPTRRRRIGRLTYDQRYNARRRRENILVENERDEGSGNEEIEMDFQINFNVPDFSNLNFRNLQVEFEEELKKMNPQECQNCHRVIIKTSVLELCQQCKKCPLKFTEMNRMNPGTVPNELKDLTYVEQLLIAKVQPVIRVYRVKSRSIPGQYAYKGNIINIGQNITEIVRILPRKTATLGLIVVRREDSNGHRDFYVRRNKVLTALIFLKNHNPYYADMIIEYENVSQLPINDSILNEISAIQLENNNENEDEQSNGIYESFIPDSVKLQEAEKIQGTINNSMPWPQGTNVINEFTCEGYVSMAFPALLPYGSAELNDYTRPSDMKMSVREYFKFLMQFKDQRFAKDPRFRFFALNTIQRHDAITKGTIFAKKSHFDGTIEQLRNTMVSSPQIIRSLYFWCGQIRGTKSYWFQRRVEIEAMLNQLGMPTVFLTLSAADLWWPDLARLMNWDFSLEENLNESQIAEQRQKLINENPLIVEDFFSHRATFFIENVLCKRYEISDYWFRFEFQHRGSCHLHGLLWLVGAPDAKGFDNASEQGIFNAKTYYDSLVSAFNPLPLMPPAAVHPSRIRSTDVDIDNEQKISELLNRFQRHTKCTKGYCLKRIGVEYVCRFNYPKEVQQQSLLQKNEKGQWVYTPARNDTLLNNYNLFISQTWRANTDFSIITSEHMLIKYLAKYASKSEPASKNLTEMFQEVVESKNNEDQSRRAYTSLMMKIIGERDIGACETCHLLLEIPLFHCTRSFQVIVIKLEDYIAVSSNENGVDNSFVSFYCKRPREMEEISLFEFAKKFSKGKNQSVSKNRKEKIVQVCPKINKKSSNENLELYYKQKIMTLKFWRNVRDLKNDDESWEEASVRHNLFEQEEINTSLDSESSDNENDDEPNENGEIFNERDWMAIAAVMPHELPENISLGNRDLDLLHDWKDAYFQYPGIKNHLSFIEKNREAIGDQCEHIPSSGVLFNEQQNKILQFLEYQLDEDNESQEKLAIIQGKAGTGKSCIINEMVTRINLKHGEKSALLMAPTGVAANNINGQTIHSALHIPPKGGMQQSTGNKKIEFEEEYKNLKFVIIDEASMLGLNLFFKVDQRLREAKPQYSHLPFGGVCVYLVGDWAQLPPVCDQSLYNVGKTNPTIQASLLYKEFKKVFFLTQIMRQQGEEQRSFRETLERISTGEITEDDYQLLSTRFFINNVRDNSFENAVCIMSKNADIDKFNYEKLEKNKQPIALINAVHNCPEASNASIDDAQGLPAKLYLCRGARVILRRNLWVAKGLANGSVGTVTNIIYDPDVNSENYNDHLPLCILVNFDNYTGPAIHENSIPIVPINSSFKKIEVNCNRKQFPLNLGHAISVHRSQGITLDKAIVDIGDREFSVGLSYVGFSRVKTLNGLLIKPAFNYDRLKKINQSTAMIGRRNELKRLVNIAAM